MKVNCCPGLGDHNIVSAEALLKPTLHKEKPRKVLLFVKADWTTLKAKKKLYQQSFLLNQFGNTVEELWTDFTKALDKLSQECITSKIISGKSSLPWIASSGDKNSTRLLVTTSEI